MASPGTDDDVGDEHLFDGVRFFLVGFESDDAFQYRSEMVRRGGADARGLDNRCTHVVVWNCVYDDSICVLARAEGKKVVSGLWVEDSLNRGVLADADRVIYWPLRHLKGIPGAQSLLICLTGYQRNCREEITKMVSLMGARFSKSLIANMVTHLICYKFEGEKYEVAKRMKIKLVNHRWLEDCLKAWEILPVDDYSKSSWELELMEAKANDSEHEAEAAGPRSLNHRSSVRCTLNSKGCEETFVQPVVNAPKRSPITPNGNREVYVGSNLNTPDYITKTRDADNKTHDITGQGSPNSSLLAVSAKVDALTPIQTSICFSETRDDDDDGEKRDNDAVRNINSPNLQEAEEKYVGAMTHDLGTGVLSPSSSSKMTVFSNHHHLDALNRTPDNLNGHMDHISGKYSVSHDHIDVREVILTSPSRGNQSVDELDSSKVDRWQNQEKDRPSGIRIAAAGRSNTDEKLANHESNPSMSNHIKNTNNSKKASHKSLLKRHSVNHVPSPHRAEESTLRADSSISSLKMGQQKVVERADIESMKCSESTKSVDGLDGAYAQRRKSFVSASFNLQKEALVSETGPLDFPFVSRLSDASEPAKVSSERKNLAEATSVNLGEQQVSLSTSRQTRSRRTLKHGGSANGIKPPQYSTSAKNEKSLPKARKSLKAVAENKCTTIPSANVQDGETSSGFSFQNKDREETQGSCSAVNQDLLHEIGNARMKDRIHEKSVHNSSNSQVISSGNAGTKITDPLKDNNNVVAVVPNSEVGKLEPGAHVKEGLERFQDTSSNVQGETGYSKKVTAPIKRNAGSKRPRGASVEAEGSLISSGKKVVPESWPAEVTPHEHADSPSKNGCSTASAAELKTNPPKKTATCRVTDTVAKRTRSACAKMDGAQVASCSEFSDAIAHENIETNPKRFFDIANPEHRNSPKKIPNTRVRNASVKRSLKADINMSNETLVDKTETVAAGSLFDDLFPLNNVEDCPKEVPGHASASDCRTVSPKTVSNTRVSNAVAKGKMKTIDGKLGSKCGKIGSAIASVAKAVSSKRTEEISCNSKLRSSKRNKAVNSDHEKEIRLDCSDLNSKSNKTGSLCSQSDSESMQKSTYVLSEHQRVKGSEPALTMCEPALFILSGNRQQRRDCRSILRRLKGRVCRDSHHWSYQATHFIVPDPLKRTEKFFAAAAAGRWILKIEYLTSCIEAGKFVDEEPFEWFGAGLNDGETISLDAPRKWRKIRQQLGHGAFYGMQIIVYGQLTLPTLDTVKRAVKAGDGTVLATSPPYTRVLDSGVDFAVVSESTPRADTWVQEFIRRGIPCVTADYLVEYVCKAGHPLDRHVLFKTDALASKSLEKLVRKQREVAAETEPSDHDSDEDPEDLSCSACGRKDRGEVMLICGDEDGETGCGVGMHIDCCDPPLDAVPDDDWLCPKCTVPRAKAKRKPARGTERKATGSRRR
ncbi:hypothetical protein U9M48_007154 [Paspalum notatum var. saurae]|uniref:BRCT domain-containing protein n=1 Tax=Paspalum notatum var. saurae TaxID=547442 RepID=A0AAQ3PTR1_PASNO